jgi:neutral ceramidase
MSALKVGAARRDITPGGEVEMRGSFSRRPATRANDPLYAKALYLEDDADRAVLVTCDLICVTRELLEASRQRLGDSLGLEPRQVILTGTHTHSGPHPGEPEYQDLFVTGICEAAEEAAAEARQAIVKTARAMVYGISFNRRCWLEDGTVTMHFGYQDPSIVLMDGPVDPMLGLFSFEAEGQAPIVLANYSLHACTAAGGALSADYPSAFEDCLREVSREQIQLHFTTAPCGNVNHCDLSKPAAAPGGVHRHRVGAALAEAAWRVLKEAKPIEATPVRAVSRKLTLKCRPYTEQELEEARKVEVYDSSTWGGDFLEATKKLRVVRCEEWGGQRELEIQALRFGEGALAFLPGEIYVEFAIRLKKESPLYPHTYAVELSGDDISYVPVREAFSRGGYTVYACRFEPGCGEAMTDAALAALDQAAKA